MQWLDGRALADKMQARIQTRIASLAARPPHLAVVLVGEDAASKVYVAHKKRACAKVGIISSEYRLPADTAERDLVAGITELNHNDAVDGILVQLPLPAHIQKHAVIAAIDPAKDVDGFHEVNAGRLWGDDADHCPLAACTAKGVVAMAKSVWPSLSGKTALVMGRSHIVGRPTAELLLQENATVSIAHSRTPDNTARRLMADADMVVVAIGKPKAVSIANTKPGAMVIDVGIHRQGDVLVGDVDTATCPANLGYLTPVPGGVGPMTIALLLENTLAAYQHRMNPAL